MSPSTRQWGTPNSSPISGALLYNADPRGSWAGRVSSKGYNGDGSSWDRADKIKVLFLRFNVIAVPDKTLDGSFWITEDRV